MIRPQQSSTLPAVSSPIRLHTTVTSHISHLWRWNAFTVESWTIKSFARALRWPKTARILGHRCAGNTQVRRGSRHCAAVPAISSRACRSTVSQTSVLPIIAVRYRIRLSDRNLIVRSLLSSLGEEQWHSSLPMPQCALIFCVLNSHRSCTTTTMKRRVLKSMRINRRCGSDCCFCSAALLCAHRYRISAAAEDACVFGGLSRCQTWECLVYREHGKVSISHFLCRGKPRLR